MKIKLQKSLEISRISPQHFEILWINVSAPSLGDSLMDLSSRIMLGDRKVDLFTDKKNAHIYRDDRIFNSVYTEVEKLHDKNYDLVILDSYSSRSIRFKVQIAPKTFYVGMFGFYNGPEVNRVLFSFHQMNNLLGLKTKEAEINQIAKPTIFVSIKDKNLVKSLNLPAKYISIVVGGDWAFRTYNSWDLVIEKLVQIYKNTNIILVGSQNGMLETSRIIKKFKNIKIKSFVSELTFNQTAEIIRQANYTICCDGGLMHAANAVDATIVSLLAKLDKSMQLTQANNCFCLYDKKDVNNISPESIVQKCKEALNFACNHPQNE